MATLDPEVSVGRTDAVDHEDQSDRIQRCLDQLPAYDSSDGMKRRRENGSEFLRWAVKHSTVSVQTSNVPDGILPSPYSGCIHDLRVFSKSRGPDDAIYDAHADLREQLARGNLVLELKDGPLEGQYTALRALRKFTGGEVWDDDDRCDAKRGGGDQATSKDAWQQYFTSAVSEAKCLVSTRKVNGEAAHLSVVKIEGESIVVVGSKNTHILVRNKNDVQNYTDGRFRVARIFANHVLEYLEGLKDDQRSGLLDFLWRHSLTAVFEILMPDHQHVENLSAIEKFELKFIAWTSNEGGSSFTALPVDVGLQVASNFGLDPTSHKTIESDQLNSHVTEILQTYGSEGVVLYFLDKEDRTIGLLKKKTAWYVLCRAVREKAKGTIGAWRRAQSTFSLAAQQKKVNRRFEDIASWLKLSSEVMDRWRNLANNFLSFCIRECRNNQLTMDEVANMFPVVWKRYLDETGSDDHVFDSMSS